MTKKVDTIKTEAVNDKYIEEIIKDSRYRFYPDGRAETLMTKQGHIGKVWRDCRSIDRKTNDSTKVYYRVSYTPLGGKRMGLGLHRIIWALFNTQNEDGSRMDLDPKLVIRHLNDCSTNNCIENLYLGTHRDNMIDSFKNGRMISYGNAKFSMEEIRQMRAMRIVLKKTYQEIMELFPSVKSKGQLSDFINERIWPETNPNLQQEANNAIMCIAK